MESRRVGEADRNAGNQHEHFRRVGKAEIANGQPLEDGAGHVIDKDRQKGKRSEDVEPRITFGLHAISGLT